LAIGELLAYTIPKGGAIGVPKRGISSGQWRKSVNNFGGETIAGRWQANCVDSLTFTLARSEDD
jgi:hypothetical protein